MSRLSFTDHMPDTSHYQTFFKNQQFKSDWLPHCFLLSSCKVHQTIQLFTM